MTFAAGGATLGTSTLSGGVASLTVTSLPTGTDAITASYSGDGNFLPATASAGQTVNVTDFALTVPASGASVATHSGGTASFAFSLASVNGFSGPVTMSATGLPAGATISFAPAVVTVSPTGTASTTVTVTTSSTLARLQPGGDSQSGKRAPLRYGILLLPVPLLWIRRRRRRYLPRTMTVFLLALVGLGAIATTTVGCGGNGTLSPAPSTYSITVIGASGPLQHSTTVTLTVQ